MKKKHTKEETVDAWYSIIKERRPMFHQRALSGMKTIIIAILLLTALLIYSDIALSRMFKNRATTTRNSIIAFVVINILFILFFTLAVWTLVVYSLMIKIIKSMNGGDNEEDIKKIIYKYAAAKFWKYPSWFVSSMNEYHNKMNSVKENDESDNKTDENEK